VAIVERALVSLEGGRVAWGVLEDQADQAVVGEFWRNDGARRATLLGRPPEGGASRRRAIEAREVSTRELPGGQRIPHDPDYPYAGGLVVKEA
jgi:hypothetical protein